MNAGASPEPIEGKAGPCTDLVGSKALPPGSAIFLPDPHPCHLEPRAASWARPLPARGSLGGAQVNWLLDPRTPEPRTPSPCSHAAFGRRGRGCVCELGRVPASPRPRLCSGTRDAAAPADGRSGRSGHEAPPCRPRTAEWSKEAVFLEPGSRRGRGVPGSCARGRQLCVPELLVTGPCLGLAGGCPLRALTCTLSPRWPGASSAAGGPCPPPSRSDRARG